MKSIVTRCQGMCKRLHKDESAPNTIEWVLLVVVALVVLIGIYYIAQWAMTQGQEASQQSATAESATEQQAKQITSDWGKSD